MCFCVYFCVVVEGMYICMLGNFGKEILCLYYFGVLTHIRLGMLATRNCVYVCAVVEGMYTCQTGYVLMRFCVHVCIFVEGMCSCNIWKFGNEPLCLCCCRGYVSCKTEHFGNDTSCLCLYCCREYIHRGFIEFYVFFCNIFF